MPREYKVYIKDIWQSVKKIEKYTRDMNFNKFMDNELVQDAVIRNLEIIGEAVKKIPEEIKKDYPQIDWRKISGLRDILVHAYFGIDMEIIWDVVKNKIPDLKRVIETIISDYGGIK